MLVLLLNLISFNLFAAEGMVKVLEAPLFHTPDESTEVVQYVRKGDKIYIHDSALRNEDYVAMDSVFSESNEELIVPKRKRGGDFYATIDKQGRVAYIPKKYIDVTYLDQREFQHEKLAEDPTDYRLKEPLPREYPLYSPTGYKAFITAGVGPNPKNNYEYPSRIRREKYGNNFDFTGTMTTKSSKDHRDRFYFGGMVHVFRNESSFELENGSAEEIEMKVGLGPYLSYDPFVGEKFKFTVYTALLFNLLNEHGVKQTTNSGLTDSRVYSGTSFSPRFGFLVNFPDIYEKVEQLDFIVGMSLMTEYPRKLISRQGSNQPTLWKNGLAGDEVTNAFMTGALFIGLQKRY